jgi:hypothetical protein
MQGQGVEIRRNPRCPIFTHVASGDAILAFDDRIVQDVMRRQESLAIFGDVLPKANAQCGFGNGVMR